LRERLHFLDGMRGVAALIVVFHHGLLNFTNALYTGEKRDSHFHWDVHLAGKPFLIFFAGNYAVAIFFVLSGFVLSHVFSRTDVGPLSLTIRRYVRLSIPVTAANLLSFALCCIALASPSLLIYVPLGAGFDGSLANVGWALAACLKEALVNATITGQQVVTYNGALWTMQIEFIGSLLLILIFWLSRKITKDRSDAMNLASFMAGLILVLWWQSNLALFASGVIFYRIAMNGLRPSMAKELTAVPLLILAIYLGTMPQAFSRPQLQTMLVNFTGADMAKIAHETVIYPVLDYLKIDNWIPFAFLPINIWHAVGAILLLAAVLLSEKLRDLFSRPTCIFLGKISFALYLVHTTVQHVTAQPALDLLLHFGLNNNAAMFVALMFFVSCSLVVSTVFTHIVEERAIRWSETVSRRFV